MMNVQDITDAALAAEVERRRKVREQTEYEAEKKRRSDHAEWVLKNVDALLAITPKHSKTSCTDENRSGAWDAQCIRCGLIEARECKYYPPDQEIRVEISAVVLPMLKEPK